MELYNDEAKRILKQFDWPKGLIVDVVEFETHLALRFYRRNFNLIDPKHYSKVTDNVSRAMMQMRAAGIPCYFEVYENENSNLA